MAVAVIQDFATEEGDRSTTNYDAIHARLQEEVDGDAASQGFILHAAGFTGSGFRIIEIWETREQFEQFVQERVMPLVAEIAGEAATPPEVTVFELHKLITA